MKELIKEFKASEEFQDMIADGMFYHAIHWLHTNHPEIKQADFITALNSK